MSTIRLHAVHAIQSLADQAATTGSGSRSVIILTVMLIMVLLTIRLVAKAIKPVMEVLRAAAAVFGATLLLAGVSALLVVMLVT